MFTDTLLSFVVGVMVSCGVDLADDRFERLPEDKLVFFVTSSLFISGVC